MFPAQRALCTIMRRAPTYRNFFFFNDTATTEIYPLSLHDALPISRWRARLSRWPPDGKKAIGHAAVTNRSEEHTSELQSLRHLVCRLLLEKKKRSRAPPVPPPCRGFC